MTNALQPGAHARNRKCPNIHTTANWQKLRKVHLSIKPFCRGCKAMGKPYIIANTVDHVVPISDGGPAFPGHDGLASYLPVRR